MKIQGYCNYNIINVRKRPGHTEEIVNQLLFGDEYEITEQWGEWTNIISLHDYYPGWIHSQQLSRKMEEFTSIHGESFFVGGHNAEARSLKHPGKVIPLVYGSVLQNVQGSVCNLWGDLYKIEGILIQIRQPESRDELLNNALRYLYTPYLWGGRSPYGIDCSGLTQVTFRMSGIALPRDAWMQAESGENRSFMKSEAGDLAFFGDTPGKITHVGMILNDRKILHASGIVRIDLINEEGIFNIDDRKLSHKLQKIKHIKIV